MKFYLSIILVVCCAALCKGQGKVTLGAEGGFPTGSGTKDLGTGFGGSLRYEGTVSTNLNWLFSAGYLYFPINTTSVGYKVTGSSSFVPIAVGVKYYPNGNFKGFYFGTDIGLTVISAKLTATTSSGSPAGSASASENKFAISPGLGYHFEGIDLTFRYNLISDANYFGIRVGIAFH